MRSLILSLVLLAACGSDSKSNKNIDAPTVDPEGMIDAPTGQPATCAGYCSAIMANCTAARSQYSSAADCMNSCSHWMQGNIGQMDMNNLECRAYHAGAAQADPATHCTHAGPGGGMPGVCGDICQGFCAIAVPVCPTQAGNAQQCMAACMGYSNAGMPYSSAIQSGDTKECRLYHATAAATTPGTHCPHIAANSATCQ